MFTHLVGVVFYFAQTERKLCSMKLGARMVKTGIAIVLSLFLSDLLQLPTPIFAAIAAIFAIQPTIYRSYLSVIEQIQGNVVGAVTAFVFTLAFGNHLMVVGLGAIIVIAINLKLRLENTISLSLVTLIAIMETPGENFIEFGLIRFGTIMLGVLSAFVVNLIFLPPKYESKLYFKAAELTEEITKWIRISAREATEHALLKKDIKKISEEIVKLDQLYFLYKEERNYFKKQTTVKLRKLVIYRQMAATLKKALQTLKELHRFENELANLPEELKMELQRRLDSIIDHHEQVMLKYIDKVRHPSQNIIAEEQQVVERRELFQLFMEYEDIFEKKEDETFFHIIQVISSINEYDEHLKHLDRLITSFKTYHKNANKVTVKEPLEG